jgi:phosphate transport system substrate-binding protein
LNHRCGISIQVNTKLIARAFALGLALALGANAAAFGAENAAAKAAAPAAKRPAASAKKSAKAPPLPSLTWRGDQTTARAFMKDLAKEYETSKQGRFTLQPFSTISGLDAVHEGTVDIAGSARPPMPGRSEEVNTNFYPVAWDALVMVTSPKNPVGNVTLKQLHDIYLGRVTSWVDLGGEGAINLYAVAGPLDGNEFSLRQLLFHFGDQDVAAPRLYVNVEKLEEGIAIDPHGLGVTTLSAAWANPGLKMLTVENIAASPATITDGSYPLYSTLFLAAREDAANKAEIDKFVQFAASPSAIELLRKHDLVPYRDAPTLPSRQAERIAYIDAHVRPELTAAVTAPTTGAAAVSAGETPGSAPIATADMLIRTDPNSVRAQEAKARAQRIMEEKKAAKPGNP